MVIVITDDALFFSSCSIPHEKISTYYTYTLNRIRKCLSSHLLFPVYLSGLITSSPPLIPKLLFPLQARIEIVGHSIILEIY